MKSYYLISQDARQVHVSRYDKGIGTKYEAISHPTPAAGPAQWLDPSWLRKLRQRFPSKQPDGWLVSYPYCKTGPEYAGQLEQALKEAGFENACAVADTDAVLAFYEAQPKEKAQLDKRTRILTVVMDPEQSCLLFTVNEHHRIFLLDTPEDIYDDSISDYFEQLHEKLPDVELCLMAGESPIQHKIMDEISRYYHCPISVHVGMDKAVHSGLELLAPNVVLARAMEECWFQNRDGGKGLMGAVYKQYRDFILSPIQDMLKVSSYLDQSLNLWKSGLIRSKNIAGHTKKLMEKDYERDCRDRVFRQLELFRKDYEDTVNHMFSQASQRMEESSPVIHIEKPESASLWPYVLFYFSYPTKSALDRACASIEGSLHLPDHPGPVDLVTEHRARLLESEKAMIKEARNFCDSIAGDNFSYSFDPTEREDTFVSFATTLLLDSQIWLMRGFKNLLGQRSIEYSRLFALLQQVGANLISAAVSEVEKQGVVPGENICWQHYEPEPEVDDVPWLLPTSTRID